MSTILNAERGVPGAVRQMEAVITNAATEDLPMLLGELERLRATTWTRLTVPPTVEADTDRLLGAKEAAKMLGIGVNALYRNEWPFKVKVSEGRSRYSLQGIQRFIRNREGR
jgi:hypothetical protein